MPIVQLALQWQIKECILCEVDNHPIFQGSCETEFLGFSSTWQASCQKKKKKTEIFQLPSKASDFLKITWDQTNPLQEHVSTHFFFFFFFFFLGGGGVLSTNYFCPQRPWSFWSAPRMSTFGRSQFSEHVQHIFFLFLTNHICQVWQ